MRYFNVLIVYLAVNDFKDMRYYDIVSCVTGQDCSLSVQNYSRRTNRSELRWRPPPEGWIKLTWMHLGDKSTNLTSVSYIMRDNSSNVITGNSKRLKTVPY